MRDSNHWRVASEIPAGAGEIDFAVAAVAAVAAAVVADAVAAAVRDAAEEVSMAFLHLAILGVSRNSRESGNRERLCIARGTGGVRGDEELKTKEILSFCLFFFSFFSLRFFPSLFVSSFFPDPTYRISCSSRFFLYFIVL